MQLRHLQTFVCIAHNGSFSRAAEILHIAQPALSQQIKQLEEEVGTLLFVRYARGVKLSNAGERMLAAAEDIILRVNDLKLLMKTEATTITGDVRLGLPTTLVKLLGRPIAVRTDATQANIQLQLIEAMSGHLCDWLAKGDLDVAILYDKPFYHDFPNGMVVRPIIQEPFSLILSPQRRVRQSPVKLDDLRDFQFVFPRKLHAIRALIDQFLIEADVDLKFSCDVDSLGTLVEMVREGYCTILPRVAVAAELESGILHAYDLTPAPSRILNLVWSEQQMNPMAATAIVNVVLETVAEEVNSGRWAATLL